MDENFEKFETLKSKITQYYEMRKEANRDGIEKTDDLEELANDKVEELNALKREIDELLKETGLEFEPETATVEKKFDKAFDDELKENVERKKCELTNVGREYNKIVDEYVGNPDQIQYEEKQSIVPMKTVVLEQKKQLYDKDVQSKKILKQAANVEKIKDAADMNAAVYVTRKNKILLQIEQAKLEIARCILNGEKMDSMVIQVCQQRIGELAMQAMGIASEFEQINQSCQAQLNSSMSELNEATKEAVLLEKESLGLSNKYEKCLVYSEDGILTGTEAVGRINDKDFKENEVFDERGVMVFDEADILSRTKTINVDGIVVTCYTEFEKNEIENSYYTGDSNVSSVETSTSGQVEENVDVKKEVHRRNVGQVNGLDMFETDEYTDDYEVDGIQYYLNSMPIEKRPIIGRALMALGFNKQKHKMDSISLVAQIAEKIIENSIENTQGELPFNYFPKP